MRKTHFFFLLLLFMSCTEHDIDISTGKDTEMSAISIDSGISLELSNATLGTSGKIRIFKENGVEVDCIDVADVVATKVPMLNSTPYNTSMNILGNSSTGRYRVVYYDPIVIENNKIVIKPHHGSLEHEESYYVLIDKGAFIAEGFEGISSKDEWTFTVKSAPSSTSAVTVGATNSDFTTVQAAIDYACVHGDKNEFTINIKNGVYKEQLFIRSRNNINIVGESRDGVIIEYDNCNDYAPSVGGSITRKPTAGEEIGYSGGRAVILIESSDLVRFENLTIRNTHDSGSQAEAVYFNASSHRLIFVDCNITSNQDTLNLKGFVWAYNCLVAGDVDFIWGSVDTALFEDCEIRATNGGYIVHARCSKDTKGFVFLDCYLTEADDSNGNNMYLARTGGASYYGNVTYANCRIADHVPKLGWYGTVNPNLADSDNGWKEYNSQDILGSSLDLSQRPSWVHMLTQSEYQKKYSSREIIFSTCLYGIDWLVD